jgi:branched-chain amino acid transport system substrate-binding protein
MFQLHSKLASRIHVAALGVLLILVVALVAGCGDSGTTTDGGDASASASTGPPWVIPELSILTGPGASFGGDAQWGALYAVEQINASGGIAGRQIEMDSLDTAMDPAKSVTEMTTAIGMDPIAIVGPMDQISTQAAGQTVLAAKVPFFASFNDAADLANYEGWGFSLYPFIPEATEAGVELWINENPDIKSVVIFTIPSDPALVGGTEVVEAKLKELGVTVVGKVDTKAGQMDMSAPAIKAISMKPDGYYSVLNYEEEARLTIELRKRGVEEGRRICCGFGADGAPFYDLGGAALEDTYIWDVQNVNYDSETWQALSEAYQADHDGALPYSMAITGQYNAVFAIKTAIEELGITGDPAKLEEERLQIKDFLVNATGIPGAQEPYDYIDGSFVAPVMLFQIHDAQPELAATQQ